MTPQPIQPRMEGIVNFLKERLFITTDSGDGVTNIEAGMEGAIPVPHVFCRVSVGDIRSESHRLLYLFKDTELFGFQNFFVQATYSPNDEVATLMITMENKL